MRVLYQPAQENNPKNWEECDSTEWESVGSFSLNSICVQGLVFEGPDHYSVEHISADEIHVIGWHDDPDDWPVGQRWARDVTIRCLCPDASKNGAINTNQTHVIYAESGIRPIFEAAYSGNSKIEIRDWSEFDPNRVNPLDGIWLPDASYHSHQRTRQVRGWREWTDGLDPSELGPDGRLKSQRSQGRYVVPKGTRTYYHNTADLTNNVHGSTNQNELGLTPGGVGTETGTANQNGQDLWTATTFVGEPDSSSWPTTGVYRYQIDVNSAGVDLSFGLLDQGGGGVGHFARHDNALNEQEVFPQDQTAFTGTGLHLATVTNPAWTSGSSTDRFAFTIAAFRAAGHGNQDLVLQLGETDDFADGPWPSAEDANPPFFGANF